MSGFDVDGFWTAVGATIVIWLVNSLVGALARDVESRPARARGARARVDRDEVGRERLEAGLESV